MANEEFQILKQRSLFSKLRRLFSTDTIVRNVGGKKLKVVDTDQAMYATDRNTLRDRFNRIRTSSYNQYSRDFTETYFLVVSWFSVRFLMVLSSLYGLKSRHIDYV